MIEKYPGYNCGKTKENVRKSVRKNIAALERLKNLNCHEQATLIRNTYPRTKDDRCVLNFIDLFKVFYENVSDECYTIDIKF